MHLDIGTSTHRYMVIPIQKIAGDPNNLTLQYARFMMTHVEPSCGYIKMSLCNVWYNVWMKKCCSRCSQIFPCSVLRHEPGELPLDMIPK